MSLGRGNRAGPRADGRAARVSEFPSNAQAEHLHAPVELIDREPELGGRLRSIVSRGDEGVRNRPTSREIEFMAERATWHLRQVTTQPRRRPEC